MERVNARGCDKELRLQKKEKHACYVLITCDEPNSEGKMNVEFTYQGDPMLAAYLLENAQTYMDGELQI